MTEQRQETTPGLRPSEGTPSSPERRNLELVPPVFVSALVPAVIFSALAALAALEADLHGAFWWNPFWVTLVAGFAFPGAVTGLLAGAASFSLWRAGESRRRFLLASATVLTLGVVAALALSLAATGLPEARSVVLLFVGLGLGLAASVPLAFGQAS